MYGIEAVTLHTKRCMTNISLSVYLYLCMCLCTDIYILTQDGHFYAKKCRQTCKITNVSMQKELQLSPQSRSVIWSVFCLWVEREFFFIAVWIGIKKLKLRLAVMSHDQVWDWLIILNLKFFPSRPVTIKPHKNAAYLENLLPIRNTIMIL